MFEIGQLVEARITASDSFYKMVRGTVKRSKSGWVDIDATQVIDRWSKVWYDHPTSCAISAKIENVSLFLA
jgi:hypothetical protein